MSTISCWKRSRQRRKSMTAFEEKLDGFLKNKQLTEKQHKAATAWLAAETQKAYARKDYAKLTLLGMAQKRVDQAYYIRYAAIDDKNMSEEDGNELIRLITISSVFADMLNESLTVLKSKCKELGCRNMDVVKMAEAALRSTADMAACYDKTSDLASRMFEYVARRVSERYYPAIEHEVRIHMNDTVSAEELGL